MRAVVQRVTEASVTVAGEVVGAIGPGLCVLVGVTHTDTSALADKLATRLAKLRVFDDGEGKMNRSVLDVGGEVLVISQFTLYGEAARGNRPSYSAAARPEQAEPLVEQVAAGLAAQGIRVATGRFGADMDVRLLNQGPVTITLDVD
jgi:D-tyrosyl-tRNA(Tyr) deacylase